MKAGGRIGGYSFENTFGGDAGFHAGWSSNFYYDGKKENFVIEFQENLGFLLGEKYGFKIQIPAKNK